MSFSLVAQTGSRHARHNLEHIPHTERARALHVRRRAVVAPSVRAHERVLPGGRPAEAKRALFARASAPAVEPAWKSFRTFRRYSECAAAARTRRDTVMVGSGLGDK
eukprot:363073-Chlamydomonas_euryale.AAC.5